MTQLLSQPSTTVALTQADLKDYFKKVIRTNKNFFFYIGRLVEARYQSPGHHSVAVAVTQALTEIGKENKLNRLRLKDYGEMLEQLLDEQAAETEAVTLIAQS